MRWWLALVVLCALLTGSASAPAPAAAAPAQAAAGEAAAKRCKKPRQRYLRRLSPARRRASLRRYRRCVAAQRKRRARAPVSPAPAPPAAPGAAPRWERVDAAGGPTARRDHALAAVGESVYLFGGRHAGVSLDDFWRLDLPSRTWVRLPGGPAARFGHNLVAEPGGTLLMFGGQSGGGFLADLWRFDPAAGAWTQLETPAAKPRYGAAGALDPAGGRLVVSHGFTDTGRFDDTWSLGAPPAVDVSGTNERPLRRCLVAGAAHGGGFYLFGGQSNADGFMDDLWRLDLAARTWRRLEPAARPSERNLYGAAQAGASWFIHGGATPSGAVGDLWRLDLATGEFSQLAPEGERPAARSAHAAAAVPGGIVVFGGAAAAGDAADVWRLRAL